MAIYKNDNGTWYVMIRYQDWTGARKQKCKRGFSTRKEAADWELQFKLQKKASVDMTMESFCTMYEEDLSLQMSGADNVCIFELPLCSLTGMCTYGFFLPVRHLLK